MLTPAPNFDLGQRVAGINADYASRVQDGLGGRLIHFVTEVQLWPARTDTGYAFLRDWGLPHNVLLLLPTCSPIGDIR